jgi:CTP synthase
MRLGSYPATLTEGSVVAQAYGEAEITERHRHRYEVNNSYRDALSKAGLVFSGTSPDGRLVEFIELDRATHPFFVATQAHPELKSRPTRAHPLFAAFVKAAVDYNSAGELPVDVPEVVAEPVGRRNGAKTSTKQAATS